jgi:hypothetical protein
MEAMMAWVWDQWGSDRTGGSAQRGIVLNNHIKFT